jgi:mannosyltransferase
MHTTEGDLAARTSEPPAAPQEATSRDAAPVEVLVVGVVALVVGTVLRFVTTSSLWLDEALTVNIAEMPVGDVWDWLRHDGHPPLYYVLLHGWIELFGSGDVAVRALSGVFGLLTFPLAWLAGRRLGGPLLGWLTVVVVALSPFAVRYSNEARMYSLVMLLSFAGYLLLDDVLRRGRDDWLRLAGIALVAGALLWTHYWAIWLLGAAGLMVLWQAWRADEASERSAALRCIGALVVGGVLFLPWVPSMLYQSAHTGTPWADPMRPTSAFNFTLNDFGAGLYADAGFFGLLTWTFLLLAMFGASRGGRHIDLDVRTRPQFRAEALAGARTFGIGIVMAYVLRGAYAPRYAAVIFPFLVLLVAGGVTRFAARWLRFGVLLVLVAYLGVGAAWNIRDTRTQASTTAPLIDEYGQPNDLVVYCPDQLGPAGSRVVRDDVDQVAYPTFGDPRLVDWVDYQERNDATDPSEFAQRVLDEAGPDRGIFVVWSGLYKTFEDDCEELVDTIGAARPTQVLQTESGAFFEKEFVYWFPVAS